VPTSGAVTGTLTYAERAALTPDATAIVVLVEHSGDPITARIIESRVMANPGQVPISYELPYTADEIDQEAVYTVSAAIVDGSRLWATDNGTRVITYGNPTSDVALELILRSDLLKGQVTGEITGEGIALSGTGFSTAVLFDATSNMEVGMTVVPAPTGIPINFSVPFDPAEIDDAAEYVVVAGIVEGDSRWANRVGVPVITNGNPFSGIVVPVSAVEPSPSPEASDGGLSPLVLIVLLLLIAGAVAAAVWYYRSRQTPPPDDGGTPTDGTPTDEAPPSATEPPAETEVPPVEDVTPGSEPAAPDDVRSAPAPEPEPPAPDQLTTEPEATAPDDVAADEEPPRPGA